MNPFSIFMRLSFWRLNTRIERQYPRIDGVWLCVDMESTSNIFIAGPWTLKVDYDYSDVKTEGTIEKICRRGL